MPAAAAVPAASAAALPAAQAVSAAEELRKNSFMKGFEHASHALPQAADFVAGFMARAADGAAGKVSVLLDMSDAYAMGYGRYNDDTAVAYVAGVDAARRGVKADTAALNAEMAKAVTMKQVGTRWALLGDDGNSIDLTTDDMDE